MNNENQIERLSQKGECRNESEGSLLARASAVANGVLEEIKTLAGTTSCKSVQLVKLKQWAQDFSCALLFDGSLLNYDVRFLKVSSVNCMIWPLHFH